MDGKLTAMVSFFVFGTRTAHARLLIRERDDRRAQRTDVPTSTLVSGLEKIAVSANLEDWWQWRRSKDQRLHDIEIVLADHTTQLALLDLRQKIINESVEAKHSKGPQIAYMIFAGAISLIALVLQLLAWRIGTP